MNAYLGKSDTINWDHPHVLKKARDLARGSGDPVETARKCFNFVRDMIRHSNDYQLNPVTCSASEVLQHETGFCYSKSHLLAALLRANNIPAGICYQRVAKDDIGPPFCLHALNAIHLADYGWYRVDARGNKAGVEAAFCPPNEQLAFPTTGEGELDLPEIWPDPLPVVINLLTSKTDFQAVSDNLPDIQIISGSIK